MKNYYEILGIKYNAEINEIKKAFRINAIKYHPDKHFNDEYFKSKFIEIKEAYDILSNEQLRIQYDKEYKQVFLNNDVPNNTSTQTRNEKENIRDKKNEQEEDQKYHYNPYTAFYSYLDRQTQETPQYSPKIDHWGRKLDDDIDFFIFPKKIGKLISGYSTLKKSDNPPTSSIGKMFNQFNHFCSFMGVNGFAEFHISKNRTNVVKKIEINFNDILHLISSKLVRYVNLAYDKTEYGFHWAYKDMHLYSIVGKYKSKDDKPNIRDFNYWTNQIAEKYYTVYRLDNLEKELNESGYIEFDLFTARKRVLQFIPYIRLGIGYIEIFDITGQYTPIKYNFNEIKEMYVKKMQLYIVHNNYVKKNWFVSEGNKSRIPLDELADRNYFIKAMEILLGFKFV